jgi:hypothetical protein
VPHEGLRVRPGETVSVDFSLRACLSFGTADYWVASLFNRLLTAAAVVHLRITETGPRRLLETEKYCGEIDEARATIVGVGRVAHDEWQAGTAVGLRTDNVFLRAGDEYLALLTYDAPSQRFRIDASSAWEVVNGRVDGLTDLGIHDGTPTAQVLQRLRATYRLHARYRQYDNLEPTASLDTLRNKTGWLALEVFDLKRNAWTNADGDLAERPFDFVENPQPSRTLPRPGDRIRVKEGGPITIIDYGSRGEALRKRSPAGRPDGMHVSDLTGTRAAAGGVYAVADVQLERYGDQGVVWVRLVATR